ncbi:hypothetical protein SDC9_189169 [bioreactor metagenome]|uniref:Uncharacterized protein n=1 Tax=bioreactor metagenome TaxID=1076179 RepID=A0A645HRE1_9ZZZZ
MLALLKVSIYRKKPVAPDSRNHGMSFLLGGFIFFDITTIISDTLAAIYLKSPRGNGEKYCNARRVNTYANDQNKIVVMAYG